jgi:hypothetical protein
MASPGKVLIILDPRLDLPLMPRRVEPLSLYELKNRYRVSFTNDIAETQFIVFTSKPDREQIIRELLDIRACALENISPLEIDELLGDDPT